MVRTKWRNGDAGIDFARAGVEQSLADPGSSSHPWQQEAKSKIWQMEVLKMMAVEIKATYR